MPLAILPLLLAPAPPVAPPALQLEGGNEADRALAAAAFALRPGEPLDEARLALGLAAIRATDRFQHVEGQVREGQARVRLLPWPRTEQLTWIGLPSDMKRWIPPELRQGAILGEARLKAGVELLTSRLRDLGFPQARIEPLRESGGRQLTLQVHPGPPRLVRRIEVRGPLSEREALAMAALPKGPLRHSEQLEQQVVLAFRRGFLKQDRLEGHVTVHWEDATGSMILEVQPGPIVELAVEGRGLSLRTVRKALPLARADRYTPDLAAEGDRRLQRLLLNGGYLEAQVSHRRTLLAGTPEAPQRVRLTYLLQPGPRYRVEGLQISGARDVSPEALREEVRLPLVWPLWGGRAASPAVLDGLRGQLLDAYRRRGHADAEVVVLPPSRGTTPTQPAFRVVREGEQRLIQVLELEVPATFGKPWPLAHCLAAFLDQPTNGAPGPRDLPALRQRPAGRLEEAGTSASGSRFRLVLERPIPLLKRDLSRVVTALRQQRRALGIQRPQESRMAWVEEAALRTLRLQLAEQPSQTVRRLVYRGADRTSPVALARESLLSAGTLLDPDALARTQGGLANLGGFARVDLLGLKEEDPGGPWQEGDLLVRMIETSPWVFSHGFGYDKSQGYHTTLGIQRLNLNGMGRVLDLGIRAGDGTLRIPALRRLFPTGEFPRSVDMYTLGYTDPWFAPGALRDWLPPRTVFRSEAAFVEERRDSYLVRRRRWQNSLEWKGSGGTLVQTGLRYERVRVVSAIDGISDEELNATARMPSQARISAPYLQVLRDRRDNPVDPTSGTFSSFRLELANQAFGTSPNTSFVKIDLRQQWHWPLGDSAQWGIATLGLRLGAARPTDHSARQLPLSERFFAGGPFTHRGVEPDWLGPQGQLPVRSSTPPFDPELDEQGNPRMRRIPVGGQAIYLANLEWRFPLPWVGNLFWGEIFMDSGMVVKTLHREDPVPGEIPEPHAPSRWSPRTALGFGLIAKVGIPLKVEYAVDLNRLLGRPRSPSERASELKGILFSAGFQF